MSNENELFKNAIKQLIEREEKKTKIIKVIFWTVFVSIETFLIIIHFKH
jgi:hypothetical protein